MSRSLPHLTLTTSTSSLTYITNLTIILFYTPKTVVSRSIITLRRFTAELRFPRIPNLPQVVSPKRSSSTGILRFNIKIKHDTGLREMTIKIQSLKIRMNFGKIGVKSLSCNQSLIRSAYDSAESIADSDLEDERLREILA